MTQPAPLSPLLIDPVVTRALQEDLSNAGDITTAATIPANTRAKAVIAARAPGVVAGVEVALAAFRLTDPTLKTGVMISNSARVCKGDAIIDINGPARALLGAERVALNFLGRLCGVATATAALVDAVRGTGVQIACTRKTTPGLRAMEKYAVRCGGGVNHRFGLYDAVMLKDNHIAAAGGIEDALKAARASVGHMVKIEVEIDRLDQLDAALKGGADVIMLDNMTTEDMKRAVEKIANRAVVEASGNVTIETVRAIAETGVDVISTGAITHSAPCLDVGLDFQ